MLADARVSLLIADVEAGEKSPLGLERVSVQARAERIDAGSSRLPESRAAYLARFPDAERMFDFADFSIFLIRPASARFVAGFGQAHSLSAETLVQILQTKR
jgi:putative heme iron utilization protein